MIAGRIFQRFFHSTRSSFTTNNKSLLATLRQKTGYTFSNCKKALELHNYDLSKAEDWLQSQAKAEGWAKIGKLKGRAANEGLIALINNNNLATMVEVNCETDFVARNDNFQSMIAAVAQATLGYATDKGMYGHEFCKIILAKPDLSNLKTIDGEHTLADLIAWHVNLLGENIALKRAVCWCVRDEMQISGYIHPPFLHKTGVLMGKFGSLVCYRKLPEPALTVDVTLNDVGSMLAKQIVGMNPESIGNKEEDKPSEDEDSETKLIFQPMITDTDQIVGEFLDQNGVQVIDYIRFHCGESL
uniref:Elongation factor Ts, mitochondrial n=1 Tax=Strigamia maritima TaxID=126957 RepID=T1JEJ1_STRMM